VLSSTGIEKGDGGDESLDLKLDTDNTHIHRLSHPDSHVFTSQSSQTDTS
jgi:hypothetical protein